MPRTHARELLAHVPLSPELPTTIELLLFLAQKTKRALTPPVNQLARRFHLRLEGHQLLFRSDASISPRDIRPPQLPTNRLLLLPVLERPELRLHAAIPSRGVLFASLQRLAGCVQRHLQSAQPLLLLFQKPGDVVQLLFLPQQRLLAHPHHPLVFLPPSDVGLQPLDLLTQPVSFFLPAFCLHLNASFSAARFHLFTFNGYDPQIPHFPLGITSSSTSFLVQPS